MAHESMEQDTDAVTEAVQVEDTTQGKMFSQDELNNIVDKRLKREQAKYSDIDMEEYRELKAAKEKAENDRLMKRNEFDKILQQQKEKYDAENAQLRAKLEEIQVDQALLSAASQHKAVNPQHIAELLRSKVKLDADGSPLVYDADGNVKYNQETASPMTINEMVSEFVNSNPYFMSATPSGSGSTSNTAKASVTNTDLANLDLTRADHREIYRKMKSEGKIQ